MIPMLQLIIFFLSPEKRGARGFVGKVIDFCLYLSLFDQFVGDNSLTKRYTAVIRGDSMLGVNLASASIEKSRGLVKKQRILKHAAAQSDFLNSSCFSHSKADIQDDLCHGVVELAGDGWYAYTF